MKKRQLAKACRATACGLGIAAASAGASAAAVLEEVIVTATLRAESLQDVPVSVNAVSGEKLMEAGIDKVEDLQAYVPNLTMSETGIGTNIYIRGIGSGINPGFEQSVGMYFDGINYGRAQLSRAPFLDLSRVEVLRGPQNILFGKNSIAGALSLHSARPTQEYEGFVSALYEPEHGESVVDLIVSGPLTDTLGARVAIRKRDLDGYIENLTLDRDEPERDESTARLILDWAATENLQAMMKLEYGKFDVTGRQIEIVNDQPAKDGTFAGRRYSEILDNTVLPAGLGTIDEDSSVRNIELDHKRSSNGDFSNNETQNVTFNIDYALDDYTLTFITGYMHYEFEELCDCDFTGARVFNVTSEEEYTQFSQEFRIVSPVGETFEWIAGGYYHYSELDFFDSINVPSDILPTLVNAADLLEGGARGDAPPFDTTGGILGVGDAGDHLSGLRSPRNFTTDTELWSAFLQVTWNITDTFRATFGGRLSTEDKEGSRDLTFTNDGTAPDTDELDTVVAKNFSAESHSLKGERSETNFAPSVNLQYDLNDEVMLYATAGIGFKSGGFDARSNASPEANDPAPHNPTFDTPLIGSFEYDEEKAQSLELGAKTTLLDGAAELNIAAFYTEYDDLQVSIFDGTLGFNVGNAGAAETMGLELDGRMALSENLMLIGAIAFLDFEFTDFENGQCYQDQPDPEGDGLCDYKGQTNQYVADYSGNLSLAYTKPFGDSYEFRATGDVVFTGDYNPTQNLDPDMEQDAYQKFNGRISVANIEKGWEVALIGKNLTDEEIITYANDTPLSNSIFRSKGHYAFVERPRSIALQASYRWY